MHIRARNLIAIIAIAIGLTACGAATGQAPQPTPTIDTSTEAPTPTVASASAEEAEPTAEPEATAAAPQAAPAKDIYALGDTAQIDPFQITVKPGGEAPQPESGEPREGQQFAVFDVALHNIGHTPQDVALLLQLVLEDAAGKGYALDPGPSIGAVMTLNGRIDAGEQTEGKVVYQVPEGTQGLRLVFRTIDVNTTSEAGRVTFNIAE